MLRPRRYRQHETIRRLIQETQLSKNDLILPLFVHNAKHSSPIQSLPGHFRYSEHDVLNQCETVISNGIPAIALFTYVEPSKKTSDCKEAINDSNLTCRITKKIKATFGDDLIVIGDVALDPYSLDGHDGLVKDGAILNDETIDILAKMALIQADAGVDIIAPSDMMDGRVTAIRQGLDANGFNNTLIMSYTAKYASQLYGPFRDALDSAPQEGDKKTYQMNPANRRMAAIEQKLDTVESADILMVKPATWYLDVISDFSATSDLPISAYHTSGEYAMLKYAQEKGILDFKLALHESLTSIKRAGASMIITYGALEAL